MKIHGVILLLAGLLLSGCGLFSTKPVLPKQATTNTSDDHADEWTIAVRRADIIYFPVEAIGAVSTEQSATKIALALKNMGGAFSVAWQGIEDDDSNPDSPKEPRWNYTGKLLEQCKVVFRATIDARQLFLGLPAIIRAKLQRGVVLDGNERAIIPRGYRTPAGGLEDFAEQLAAARGLQERDIENLYRAHVVAGQFAAETVVNFMREHEGEKLLVFARRRDLSGDSGLPAFVSQKLKIHQIIFDLDRARNARPRLVKLLRRPNRMSWL